MFARLTLIALAFTATPALAQHPEAGGDATLHGTWEGTFNSDAIGTGGMKLVITKNEAWKAVITLSRDESMTAEATQFTVQGDELSWSLGLHDQPCKSVATRTGNVIKGETTCGHGAFTFELRKSK